MTQREILNNRIDLSRRIMKQPSCSKFLIEYNDGIINGYISLARGLGIIDLDEYIEQCEEQDEFLKEVKEKCQQQL